MKLVGRVGSALQFAREMVSAMFRKISWKLFGRYAVTALAILFVAEPTAHSQTSLQSRDAYVRQEGDGWIIGTSLVEEKVRFTDGRLLSVSRRNKKSGREYQDTKDAAPEVQFTVDGE